MSKVKLASIPVDCTVEEIYGRMTVTQSLDMVALLEKGGYTPTPLSIPEVDKWYAEASEGSREHMANKLAKYGYPTKGKHSKPEETFSRGDRLKRKGSKYIYMLANAGPNTVQIVNLTTGQRWDEPARVKDVFKITRPELAKITQNSNVRFEKVAQE